MDKLIDCFFAYSSQTAISEVIEIAIEQINKANIVLLKSWKSLAVSGKLIVQEVCEAIDKCELFICDVSVLNMNVLFELGYAVAANKRIWITLDPSIKDAKSNYENLGLLTTVGYAPYENSYQLSNLFFKEEPYKDLNSTIYKDMIEAILNVQNKTRFLFYLKSEFNTEASSKLSRRLDEAHIPLLIDDPQEMSSQTLVWYAQNTYNATAIIVHLLGEGRVSGKFLQNAKYSLIAGIAYGFHKPLLMLVDKPFNSPIDYHNILKAYEKSSECISFVDAWLPKIERDYLSEQKKEKDYHAQVEAAVVFREIDLGEPIAENEREDLIDYFIITAAYNEAIKSSQSLIYVGRKGSGKTANCFKIADQLYRDSRNHICIIKPIDYELEGVIRLLNLHLSNSEQGYLLASIWKFLVYTEIAKSVYDQIKSRPIHYAPSDDEIELILYVEKNPQIILSEFTVRMEYTIEQICKIDIRQNVAEYRAKVSETLHESVLKDLREIIGKVLGSKQKVCILVDNLDKAWRQRSDLKILADFIFGLLSVSRAISDEFERSSTKWKRVNLSLIVFLRSDIFSYIMLEAREIDKLAFKRIEWNDPILLKRVIEERFMNSSAHLKTAEEVWNKFFIEDIGGIPTSDYIIDHIIPRPRDIIYFCKSALSTAINHNHSKIHEIDVIQAEKEYSEYAFHSLMAETSAYFPDIENILYNLVGSKAIVTRAELNFLMREINIPEDKLDYVIELLCDLNFLGLETTLNKFEFAYSEGRKKVLQSLAKKMNKLTNGERFKINVPFHKFLGIEDM